MYWLYLLSGLTAGSLIWSAFNDLIVYGSVLGLFVGYILVKLKENKILKEFKTKDKSKSTLRRHPTIIQKLKEGWTLEEPGK
jgi:hypothetical protein